MGLIGLMTLMGCSQADDEVEPAEVQEAAIVFASSVQEEQAVTRATAPLSDIYHNFKVWAFKNDAYDSGTGSYTHFQTVMPGFIVNWSSATAYTTTSNSSDWEYVAQGDTPAQQAAQTIKYWDFNALAYRFIACAPATAGQDVTQTASQLSFTLDVDCTDLEHAPYYSELWFSTGNPSLYPTRQFGQPVELRFQRPVARVRFLFRYPSGSAVEITHEQLEDIAFGPQDPTTEIARKGSVTLSYPLQGTATAYSWSSTPDAVDAKTLAAFTEDYQEGVEGKEIWYYVLPVSAAQQGNYQLSVTVLSEDHEAVVPAEYMSWNPGYEYTYIFKILDDGTVLIDSVQVAYHPWDTSSKDRNYEVFNW